jgi:subtilase family serine protease
MLPKALRFLLPSPLQFVLIALSLSAGFAAGQSSPEAVAVSRGPVADRLTQPIVESARTTLRGTMHPLANKANDRGAVGDGMKLDRIQVVLKRSDAQEQSLKQLIAAMHTPGSASYHKWLTPDQFGKQFGPSDADVAKLEGWLGSHGFSITKLNAGRQTLEIAGTAGQFRDTFHAGIHSYQVKGVAGMETHYANASAPDIPAALAPVFGGFASLNNFRLKSHAKVLGKAEFNPVTHQSKPEWTVSNPDGSISLALAPGDFDVQYDLNPLYAAGTNGTGQSIAIINESNINLQLVSNYRTLFNLLPTTNLPQVIIDGNDPGIDGINSPLGPNYASGEAYLDVEISGSVAPAAQINLVIADDTALESGLFLAAERAVYSNISPVLSISFGECETDQGSSNAFINSLWEQAAAQGITVMVSTGDNGSAGCDNDNSQYYAVYGQAVNGLASTPYNVAVGGTDFYYSGGSTQLSTYWNLTPNNTTPTVSLLSKIPEQPWNESQYGSNLNSVYVKSGDTETSIAGGSGGASTAGVLETTGSYGPYPKPSWQAGTGVPNDSARDLPDVSLFASSGINDTFYPFCAGDGDCLPSTTAVQISGAGGTSFASPAFAGIMALVNQKYGRQGQANYILYPLAAQFPASFHDVTAGTNTVPCATTIVYDSNNGGAAIAPKDCIAAPTPLTVTDNEFGTTTEGEIGLAAGTPAYNAGTGYDLATGLGTIDAANLVNNWASVRTGASATTLTVTPTTFVHGTAVTVSGSVTPATGGATPVGDVGLLTTSTDPNQQNRNYFPLIAGSYSGSTSTLPGGTYDVSAYFAGDSTNAPSTSSPVLVTVTPEASTTLLQVYSAANSSSNIAPISSGGGTYTYGIPLIVSAQPQNSAGKVTTVPTGSVVFSDSGKTINTAVVNVEGDAEYNAAFSPGSHSVTAAYSGDGSYGASTSSAVAFTVAKATPVITAIDYDSDQSGEAIVESNGAFFTVLVENQSSFSGLPFAAPTGTLTFTGGPSGTQSATLTPGFDPNNGYPAGVAIFQVPAGAKLGNYTFNFSYGGDTNYNTASQPIPETLNSYTGGLVSTVTATASPTQTSPAAAVQVTVTVTGQISGGAPTGTVYLISNGDTTYAVGVANLPTASGESVTVTIPVNSESLYQGTNQITAYYPGSNTYYPSSATVTIANPLSDFSLVPVTTIVNVPGTGVNAGSQTDVINLSSYNGFAGTVGLTCAGAGGVTCSLSQSSATLAAGGTAPITLTVNSSAAAAAGTYSVVVTGTNSTNNVVHTIGLQVVTPQVVGFNLTGTGSSIAIAAPGDSGTSAVTATPTNGFTGTVDFACAVTASPAGATGTPTCSLAPAAGTFAGTASVNSTLTVATQATTTAGAYTVTITATSGAITETANVAVTVAAPGSFTLSGTAVTIASQGATGTSTVTVTPANAFTGTVTLTCAVTAAPTGAIDEPTCSAASASVTGAGAATTTLTINTTAQTAKLTMPLKGIFTFGGGAALATMLLFGVPFSRRGRRSLSAVRTIRLLAVALLFGLIAGAGIGCGGGGSSGGGGGGGGSTPSGGTTTGAYTITVTGTSGTTTATTTVAVTVN